MLFGKASASLSEAEKRDRIDAIVAQVRASHGGVPEMTPAEVRAKLDAGEPVTLVDVRTPEEQAVSMIPGAVTLEHLTAGSVDVDGPVVCYCTIGGRSGRAARQLRDSGLDAYNMCGAILAWTHEGGELVAEDGRTTRVHTHSSKFDLAADGYETVW